MKSYVTQSLLRAVQVAGSNIGTICGDRQRRWHEVLDRVARMAGALQALGLQSGDRVGLLGGNSDRYFELHFAIPWAGGVIVPLNTRLAPAEIDYMLQDAGIRWLFVDEAWLSLLAACRAGPPADRVIAMADGPHVHNENAGHDYETLVAGHAPVQDSAPGGGSLAGIFYTGGNTGRSKGVMLSHDNLMANAMNAIAMVGYHAASVYLHAAPMFHLSDGMAIYSLTMMGGTHVFVPKFDAAVCLATMQHHRVTNIALVPTMVELLVRVAEQQPHDLSALRQIQFGASPMPDGTLQRALKLWPDMLFLHGWGMTELAPIGSMLPIEWRQPSKAGDRLRSCGKSALNIELRIVDEQDRDVPNGSVGEIIVRGPVVMIGYWNKPDETAHALRGGWLHTGDAAWMDAEGFIYIVDRLKDMIISGGENVYSTEVENAISRLPGVAAVAVIGIPHDIWGESVHAIIVPEAGAVLDPAGVIADCRKSIAGYKCPRSIEFQTEPLPLTGAGKVNKRLLREQRSA